MDSNRSVIETLKFCAPKDVLVATSQVCEQWHRLSSLPELWEFFCDSYLGHWADENCTAKEMYRTACASSAPFLVVFDRTNLILFDCEREACVSQMELEIDERVVAVMIQQHKALLCGGNSHPLMAFIIDFTTQDQQKLRDMIYPRRYHGVAKVKENVYVFGGNLSPQTAEKLSLLSQQWSKLPNMPQGRSVFTPCVAGRLIYLCGGNTRLCHTFDTVTETYAFLPINISASNWFIATYYKGELLLETGDVRHRWNGSVITRQKVDRRITPYDCKQVGEYQHCRSPRRHLHLHVHSGRAVQVSDRFR